MLLHYQEAPCEQEGGLLGSPRVERVHTHADVCKLMCVHIYMCTQGIRTQASALTCMCTVHIHLPILTPVH